MATTKHTIVALVQDKPGVLNRMASLFRRRGFNIDSIAVGHSETPGFSRMTIVVNGTAAIVEQVRKQVDKIVDVVRVLDISDNYFDGYQVQWSGPIRPDKYQRRRGGISVWFYQRRRLGYPLQLGIYEQITAEKQVFWCVIVGNNQLNAADEALLDAVAGSFEKISE